MKSIGKKLKRFFEGVLDITGYILYAIFEFLINILESILDFIDIDF